MRVNVKLSALVALLVSLGATSAMAQVPDYVTNMLRIYEFAASDEAAAARDEFLEERGSSLAPNCSEEAVLITTEGRNAAITFTGHERIEFPENGDRPIHARWGQGFNVSYCGHEHRIYTNIRVVNGGPVEISERDTNGDSSPSRRVSRAWPRSPVGPRPDKPSVIDKPDQTVAESEEGETPTERSPLYEDDYDPFN